MTSKYTISLLTDLIELTDSLFIYTNASWKYPYRGIEVHESKCNMFLLFTHLGHTGSSTILTDRTTSYHTSRYYNNK